MGIIYKTLNLAANPTFEYQRKNKVWYKRKKGEKEWVVGDSNAQKVLNAEFKDKKGLFFYSTTLKVGVVLLAGALTFFYSRKRK